MNIIIRNILIMMFFSGSTLSAASMTLLIETRDTMSRKDMMVRDRIKVVALESGIMDVLFDEGYIFFNTYTRSDLEKKDMQDVNIQYYAQKLGADFFLILYPEEDGSSWFLFRTDSPHGEGKGFEEITDIPPKNNTRERWISLGSSLARNVLALIN